MRIMAENDKALFGGGLLRHPRTIVALIAALHLYALLVFGATFWIDSRYYAALGEALRSAQGLADFYQQGGRWVLSHLQPGVPVLWLLLRALPENLQWPVLAFFQHAVAAVSMAYAWLTINRLWPSRFHLATALVLLLLPGYQAFHAALLTESLTSSLLLLGFAACLNIAFDNAPPGRRIVMVLAGLFLITQFRSYWGLALLLMLFVALFKRKQLFTLWVPAALATAIAAALVFPAYRFLETGAFFMPELGMNKLQCGLWVNPHPSDEAKQAFSEIPFPPTLSREDLLDKGLNMEGAVVLGRFWESSGLNNDDINKRAEQLGATLANDGFEMQIKRGIYGLASIGSILPYKLGDPKYEIMRGYDMRQMFDHQYHYHLWHAWILKSDYVREFNDFFGRDQKYTALIFEDIAGAGIRRAWEPYLSESSLRLRDPLLLGRAVPDVWLLLGILAALMLVFRMPVVTVLVLCVLGGAYATAFLAPVGNPRYANPLIPIYLLTLSIAIGSYRQAPRLMHHIRSKDRAET